MEIGEYERILITGGSGFIGRALVRELVSKGIRPMIADRNVSESETDGSYDIARVDLTDHTAVGHLVRDYLPQLVIHLAGATLRDDPTGEYCNQLNFVAAASMLDQLAAAGTRKAVLMGTAGEYGDNLTPFREDMEPRPVSHYARSKAKATAYALGLYERTGFDSTVLRTFTAYGHGQPANMFLSQLVTHAVLNRGFKMSDGVQQRDLVFVTDVVRALIAASTHDRAAGRVINIGTGRGVALRDAARFVWEKCGADPAKLEIGAIGKSGDDPFDTLADNSLAAELLDWHPLVSFEDGISQMIDAERTSTEAQRQI